MKKVNVLLGTEVSNNNILLSYWSILYENLRNLKNENIEINFFYEINERLTDADIIILSSRFFYKKNNQNIQKILLLLEKINKRNSNIVWFDLRDSAGTTQFEVMPYVKKYLKGQIYKDIKNYSKPMYGGRYYTNYYFLNYQVSDQDIYKMTLLDSIYYKKLDLSWNIGALRYDLRFSNLYKIASYSKVIHKFLTHNNFTKYNTYKFFKKKYRVNAIYNNNFDRESVAFQRLLAIKKLKNINQFDLLDKNLNKKKYFASISNSKIVLSLFGWGEICYRDWESVILGTPFIKPDMNYLDTWPNIYIPYKTYYPVNLGLENLDEIIDFSISSDELSKEMIINSQNIIKSIRNDSGRMFCEYFKKMINF